MGTYPVAMAKLFDRIDDHLRDWISRQSLFFVATAPLDADGRVNVSPKGPIGTLRVVDDHTVAYLDIFGSGSETIAHLRENGRICVMLCAFEGPPRILRLHGRGEPVFPRTSASPSCSTSCEFEEATQVEARRSVIRRQRRADRRLLRLRRPADGLRRPARAPPEGGGQARPRHGRRRATSSSPASATASRSTGCRRCRRPRVRWPLQGAVAQLVVAPVSKTGGPRFESWLPRSQSSSDHRPNHAGHSRHGGSTATIRRVICSAWSAVARASGSGGRTW